MVPSDHSQFKYQSFGFQIALETPALVLLLSGSAPWQEILWWLEYSLHYLNIISFTDETFWGVAWPQITHINILLKFYLLSHFPLFIAFPGMYMITLHTQDRLVSVTRGNRVFHTTWQFNIPCTNNTQALLIPKEQILVGDSLKLLDGVMWSTVAYFPLKNYSSAEQKTEG